MSSDAHSSGAWLSSASILKATTKCLSDIKSWRASNREAEAERILASRWHFHIRTIERARTVVASQDFGRYHYEDAEIAAWNIQGLARQLLPDDVIFVTTRDFRHFRRQYEQLFSDPNPREPASSAMAA